MIHSMVLRDDLPIELRIRKIVERIETYPEVYVIYTRFPSYILTLFPNLNWSDLPPCCLPLRKTK